MINEGVAQGRQFVVNTYAGKSIDLNSSHGFNLAVQYTERKAIMYGVANAVRETSGKVTIVTFDLGRISSVK
jgi:hypothetical protein